MFGVEWGFRGWDYLIEMEREHQIEFNKVFGEHKKIRTIKECFYHKKEECKGNIKQSHSIQRNG